MNEIKTLLDSAVVKDSTGAPVITFMHISAIAVGALGLYLMIPERKRRNLLK